MTPTQVENQFPRPNKLLQRPKDIYWGQKDANLDREKNFRAKIAPSEAHENFLGPN